MSSDSLRMQYKFPNRLGDFSVRNGADARWARVCGLGEEVLMEPGLAVPCASRRPVGCALVGAAEGVVGLESEPFVQRDFVNANDRAVVKGGFSDPYAIGVRCASRLCPCIGLAMRCRSCRLSDGRNPRMHA